MLLKHKAVKSKTLVLTFDDGPSSQLTPAILKILADYDVKATFFLLGRNIIGREEIVRQIAMEEHDICSHGYDHINYWCVSPLRSLADIIRGWKAIDTTLGTRMGKYPFRPPYGKLDIVSLVYLLLKKVPIIYWSMVSGDTWPLERRDPQRLAKSAEKAGGGIALVHDFSRTQRNGEAMVLESIRSALETALHAGIKVKSMSELRAERW
ncbi:MAG: polysaccharide deacetylase family protein [Planctomycetota bacterium]|jgi:peptidoglycan/xylan/chitin deacetylase (PgdA/CDA1 family)